MSDTGWMSSQWFRAVGPDGELWIESSNEEEVRKAARPDDRIDNLWRRQFEEWREA